MRALLFFLLGSLSTQVYALDGPSYDRYFTNATLRVDYDHTGTKGQETISLTQCYREGIWPGSRVNLLDTLNLGEFILRVTDKATNVMIYSRGFSSVFNEWQTTDEAAAGVYRTFSESVRFPYPKKDVVVAIARRDKHMNFHELFSMVLNPNDPVQVNKRNRQSPYPVVPLMENGSPSEKVDILILGDGYAKGDMDKFRRDSRHFNDVMFGTSPFKERKKDFNVWTIEVESPESGIDIPDKDIWKGNTLGTMYNTFGSARYVLTTANKIVRDVASAAPYDFLCILVNDSRYGGGGIFNLYSTAYTNEKVAGQDWQMDYVYVHEFGHSFGGLADEYYTSSTSYNDFYSPGVEPWEPNVTALVDVKNIKWKTFLSDKIEIPTPWAKAEYDSLEVLRGKLDRLASDYYEKREPLYKAEMHLLHSSPYAGKVGAFEGAGYATKGLFRPSVDCRMFSLSLAPFDPVCSAAISKMIDFYSAKK